MTMPAIRRINSPDYFAKLCKVLLSAEYSDFQTIDDSGGDGGNDGYSERAKMLFQLYCPEKPEKTSDRTFKDKIREDLDKAKRLADAGKYEITDWIFVTPFELREPVQLYLRTEAKARGFAGVAWADPKLGELLAKHAHLRSQFPDLIHADIERQLETGFGEMQGRFDALPQQLGELVGMAGGMLEVEHDAELDHGKDLLEELKYKEALDYLENLHRRIFSRAEPRIRFRLLTNLAVAKAGIGRSNEAGALFVEAHQYKPDDEKAICNRAIGHALLEQRGDAQTFARRVIERNPLNARAHQVLVQCEPLEEPLHAVIDRVPNALREEDGVASAIAHAAYARGDVEEGIRWLETALSNVEGNPAEVQADLAAMILQSFFERGEVLTGMQVRPEDRESIGRAASLLTEAMRALGESETIRYRAAWYANRSTAHRLFGELEKALADTEMALRFVPDDPMVLKQKAHLLLLKGQPGAAIELLRRLVSHPDIPEASLMLAEAHCEQGDRVGAAKVLEQMIAVGAPAEVVEDCQRFLLRLALEDGDLERARTISASLRTADPGNVLTLVGAFKVERTAGDETAARSSLDQALAHASESTPLRHRIALANALCAAGRFADAVPLYEQFVDVRVLSELSHRLLIAYYETGDVDKALAAWRLREGDAHATQIAFALLVNIGDLAGAVDVAKRYLVVHPEDGDMRVRLGTALVRADRLVELDELLDAEVDVSQLPLDAGFQLAALLASRGQAQRSLDLAYELRRRYIDEGDAHFKYVGAIFGRERGLEGFLHADVVGPGVAVSLREEDGRSQWYMLEDRADATAARGELRVDSALGKKLLGRKVGDEVVTRGRMTETRMTVAEVKSKYVHALHESLELLPVRFADTEGIERFSLRSSGTDEEMRESVQKMLDVVTRRDEQVEEAQALYQGAKISVGTFARLVGRNVIDVWSGLSSSVTGVRTCMGTAEERAAALGALSSADAAVLDITALLTAFHLDLLALVQAVFTECLVTQSTIDLISEAIFDRTGMASRGFMIIYKEGDQYYRREITAEELQAETERLRRLREWVKANCRIVPVQAAATVDRSKRERLEEVIGKSSFESMLAAQENGCPLYSDDLGTRALAAGEHNLHGVWSQVVVIHAADIGIIPRDTADQLAVKLVLLNYRHTTVNDAALAEAARQAGWKYAAPLANLVDTLAGANAEIRSASTVIAGFVALLWQEPMLETQREGLLVAILNTMARARTADQVARHLEPFLRARFMLNPIVGGRVLRALWAWRMLKLQ